MLRRILGLMIEGRSVAEIACRLGIPAAIVQQVVHKLEVLDALRQELQDEIIDLDEAEDPSAVKVESAADEDRGDEPRLASC
jgi:hypothetical protein